MAESSEKLLGVNEFDADLASKVAVIFLQDFTASHKSPTTDSTKVNINSQGSEKTSKEKDI